MKISCQSCQSKYNVADEKVQGKIVKIRCRKCGATIVVNATATSAAANGSAAAQPPALAPVTEPHADDSGTAGGAASGGEGEWHVSVSDNDQRTMSLAELVNAYNTGVVAADTYVWTEGMQDWKALNEVEDIVAALHAAAGSDAPAAAVGGYAYAAPAPAPAPAAAPVYEAPVAPRNYEQTAAYPAGLGVQAAIAAPAPEPKRAAVVRREARARDLFATRAGEEQAAVAPEGVDNSPLTGQRNENSVLFSLEHLTRSAETRPMGSSATTTEDSGIIDLKALAAKAESMRPPTLHDVSLGMAPLGAAPAQFAPPLGGFASLGAEAPPKSRLPLLIGAGAGIALLLVLGIVIGLKIGGAVAPAPVATAIASAIPVPSVTATAEPSATASASATAQPSASAPVAAKKGPFYGGGAAHKPLAGGGATGAAAVGGGGAGASEKATTTGAAGGGGTQTAAPPKKGDCGCNGDLMCMMKCSTHQ
jgi:predicted Zn finger-like uncharacterized protein